LDKHWSDFGTAAVSAEAELEEFQKTVGDYRYYDPMLPKISNPDSPGTPLKLDEVIISHVRYGKESDFQNTISMVRTQPKRQSGLSITNGTYAFAISTC
jgi:hypothetical protein